MKKSLLDTILEPHQLSVRFQPIFHIKDGATRIDSLEALIRGPRGTNLERADILFDYVRRKKAEAAVDRSCIVAILNAVEDLPSHFRINDNMHASTLGKTPSFAEFFRQEVQKRSLALDRFTAEIVEHAPTYDVPGLMYTLRSLRDSGIRIALDDVGLGQSNYRMMLDCHPDYFKLDAYFVRGLSEDSDRCAVVQSIVSLADLMGGCVVAEGAESADGLATLGRMGIELFQSNLLCGAMSIQGLRAAGFVSATDAPTEETLSVTVGNLGDFEHGSRRMVSSARESACH
jgi:EAL domain-containing protein (putative c-di-GMP-specific phosphodiesterase class I)